MKSVLLVTELGSSEETFPLEGVDEVTIGRDPACTIVLRDPLVSRRHARLRVRGGRFTVEDLGSRNGTVVNGRHVKNGTLPIESGASVQIGGSRLRLASGGSVRNAGRDAARRAS